MESQRDLKRPVLSYNRDLARHLAGRDSWFPAVLTRLRGILHHLDGETRGRAYSSVG